MGPRGGSATRHPCLPALLLDPLQVRLDLLDGRVRLGICPLLLPDSLLLLRREMLLLLLRSGEEEEKVNISVDFFNALESS